MKKRVEAPGDGTGFCFSACPALAKRRLERGTPDLGFACIYAWPRQPAKACNIAQTAICGSWILVSPFTTGGSARRNSRSDDQAQQDQHSGNFCGLLCLLN